PAQGRRSPGSIRTARCSQRKRPGKETKAPCGASRSGLPTRNSGGSRRSTASWAMGGAIVTGYEPQFDFPEREGPPTCPWLFASVPRTGSTYVSHLLWASGCLGAPLEYLNFEPAGPYGFASRSPARQTELWRSALRRRTSPNGVFGLKAFPLQFGDLNAANPGLVNEVMRTLFPRGLWPRVVQLRRRDRTAHAISYARALLSGIWRKEQEPEDRPEPEYSDVAMNHALRLIDGQEAIWN